MFLFHNVVLHLPHLPSRYAHRDPSADFAYRNHVCPASGQGNSIAKDDCTKALSKFYVESGVVFWSRKVDSHACGTCKVTFTKPSVPNSVHLAGINGDAVTALRQGIETCGGAPVNVTIGDSNQPISVLLDYGAGEKC
ncbi:hypothetical protein H4Q26_004303 [Puccinia striiformis f. sp. tritici PST-130]|nr:hypothetical protein H4Q26_004303 [Puccinia striiformis f. sp. tritici PST-130]